MTLETLDVEVAGMALGAILTFMILSYLLGDNPLYRFALHLFIGALVGYSLGVVFRDVLYDMVFDLLLTDPIVVIPLALGILLVFKFFPRQAHIGNFSVAYLVGVGAAVALSGALLGTLIPQIGATGRALSLDLTTSSPLEPVNGLFIVVGTAFTLMTFAFTAPKQEGLAGVWTQIVRISGWVGRVFLTFAFGVAFAGALTASLSIFIGRIEYLITILAEIYFNVVGG